MKKNLLLLITAFIVSVSTFAQSAVEDKLMDKICAESCSGLEKSGITDKDSKEDMTLKLGLALMSVYSNNAEEIKKVYGLDVSKPDDAQKFGEKVGAVLVFKCKFFMDIVMKINQDEKNGGGGMAADLSVTGTIDAVNCSELCSVTLKTAAGEKVRLYRLEKFRGSEKLDSFSSANKKTTYKISYKIMSIYMGKSKSYETVKVIIGID